MISVLQLGTVDYATALRLQQRLVELRKNGQVGDVLLLLEHSPVITLGRNAKARNITASPELLAQRGVEVFECDRGGDVTFHGPGQIVGYPIFDLHGFPSADGQRKTLGAVEYVRRLEEVLIRTCADFGIPSKRIAGFTGVWTNHGPCGDGALPRPGRAKLGNEEVGNLQPLSSRAEQSDPQAGRRAESRACPEPAEGNRAFSLSSRASDDLRAAKVARVGGPLPSPQDLREAKIAAIGVHISHGVTSHGFALNVNNDLSFFDFIIPCGIESKPVTSMEKELGKQVPLQDVAHSISRNFGVVFESQILWLENLDSLLGHTVGVPMKSPAELRQLHEEDDIFWA